MAKELTVFKDFLKKNLSKKRYTHSLNVAAMSRELAELYGEDREKAYFAGLIHDIAKELPREQQHELALRCDIDVSDVELASPPLLHAIAGAQLLKERFAVEDAELLEAVRYHTVGAAGMSRLAQIVYLADLTSEDRDYKDVKKYRRYAHTSLQKGMYEALRYSIADSACKGNTIPPCTVAAYNEFITAIRKKTEGA